MHINTVAIAPYELESELERELNFRGIPFKKYGRLFIFGADYQPYFSQVTWRECQTITITSIGDGIKKLRALGKNWAFFSVGNHRRAQLIQDGLAKVNHAPYAFLAPQPKYSMGGWTLLDATTIICSVHTTSRYPLGKIEFIEDKETSPSRAYLKLWEFFTIYCKPPAPGTLVIDVGAAPGGWSWVLGQLGLMVTSVDKASLDPKIACNKNITFLQQSAFSLDPATSKATWFFSDIICYPEKLLELIHKWMQESSVKNFVCTIKLQGEADFKVLDQFLKIPGSRLVHLYHNKHELMWWKFNSDI